MYRGYNSMNGVDAYTRVGVESSVMSASPHGLICLLFDGARTAIEMARHHMASGDTAAKGQAISKAIEIVANGLKAALEPAAEPSAEPPGSTGAPLVTNLAALYDYIVKRLLVANLRNDAEALSEAQRLLESVASAWREIGPGAARARVGNE